MSSARRKIQILLAFTTLAMLALAVGCRGFFTSPTLTTVTVGPATPTVQQGSTLQMTATGTFDDGSTKTLTKNVFWSTSDDTTASITQAGLVTAVRAGSATITAESGTVSGSTTVTITLANLQSITVSPSTDTVTGQGVLVNYMATGHFSNAGDQDITKAVTWSTNPSSAATISNSDPTQGQLTTQAVTQVTQVTVTATSGSISGQATLTINP